MLWFGIGFVVGGFVGAASPVVWNQIRQKIKSRINDQETET